MAELFMTSPNERMSKQEASILFVLRIADITEPWSESSSLYCSCKLSLAISRLDTVDLLEANCEFTIMFLAKRFPMFGGKNSRDADTSSQLSS